MNNTSINETGGKFTINTASVVDTGGKFIYMLTRLLKGVQNLKIFRLKIFFDLHL